MPDGRWLDRDALARHISVRVDAIARLQRAGRLPNPSYHLGQRQPRWPAVRLWIVPDVRLRVVLGVEVPAAEVGRIGVGEAH